MQFRRYSQSDNEALSRVMTKIFPAVGDQRYCQWKYSENPAGLAISSLAQHKERIIGQIGLIPIRLSANDNEIVAAQEVDVLIEEEHRGLYVLYSLSKLSSQTHKQEKISFCYGFSVPETSAIGTKWGKFVKVGAIPRLVKILDVESLLIWKIPIKRLTKLTSYFVNSGLKLLYPAKEDIPEGAQLQRINRFDERFDSFWDRVKGDYPITTVRDSRYLNWRYVRPPHIDYQIFSLEKKMTREILGFIVLGHTHRKVPIGLIVDIVIPRDQGGETTRILLAHAIREFRKQKMALAVCWMFSHCHVFPELTRLGFCRREGKGRDLLVEIIEPEIQALPQEMILNKESWYVTIGDSDFS
jgi:hypothetical protein